MRFDTWELAYVVLDLDCGMVCRPMSKASWFYFIL